MTNQKLKAFPVGVLIVCWAVGSVFLRPAIAADAAGADRAGIFDDQVDTSDDAEGQEIKVGSFGQVDLHVKDLEISQVLQLLSLQSERNILASRNVAGSISADLYGVDFYEALDAVLHTNGFGYQEKGNLIFVYTAAELDVIKEAQRKLTHRIYRFNYITAADASAFVTPLLSEAGSLSVSGDVAAGFQPSIGDGGANSFAHSDTMIIHDYAENVEEIVAVLLELDRRPKQVLVEATILTASLRENNALGVDLSVLADFAVNSFINPLGVVDEVLSGATPLNNGSAAASTTVGNTQLGSAGIRVGIVTHSVAAFIRALDDVTDATIIANPKLLVLNRQRADLLVGGKQGYLSSTSTDTSTTQTVEFLEIGTQLTLRPFVSNDGFIRMELRPSVSDGQVSVLGGAVIPDTTNQEMTTNVVVRNGQTVVLGGLFKEDSTVQRNQVPGLGDIPILGALFQGQDNAVSREEVIFLITPTIVKDEALNNIGKRTSDTIEMIRLGAREGLLPWSRTKMISSHLRDAQKFYEEGDSQKALWTTNLALAIEPMSTEAIKMKERLSAQNAYRPANLSVLQDAVDQIIHSKIGPSSDQTPNGRDTHEPSGGRLVPSDEDWSRLDDIQSQSQTDDDSNLDFRYDELEDTFIRQEEAAQTVDRIPSIVEIPSNLDDPSSGQDDNDVWNWAKNILEPEQTDNTPSSDFSDSMEDSGPAVVTPAIDLAAPTFEDDDEFTEWLDSNSVSDELLQQMIETQPAYQTQPHSTEPDADMFESNVEPEMDELLFDEDAAFVPAMDEDWPAVKRQSDSINEGFDDSATFADDWPDDMQEEWNPDDEGFDDDPAAFVPAIDETELYMDEIDLDTIDLEWDEEPQVTPIRDESFEYPVDEIEDSSTDQNRHEFIDDRVGSTDPFNAVVEWLLAPDQEPGQ